MVATYIVETYFGLRDRSLSVRASSPRQAALTVAALIAAAEPERTQAEVFERLRSVTASFDRAALGPAPVSREPADA